jgi:hypothetical protein
MDDWIKNHIATAYRLRLFGAMMASTIKLNEYKLVCKVTYRFWKQFQRVRREKLMQISAHVCSWHFSDMPGRSDDVRYSG